MGRGKIELLYALLDQKFIGLLFWEYGNKFLRGVKQFLRLGWLINNNDAFCKRLYSVR